MSQTPTDALRLVPVDTGPNFSDSSLPLAMIHAGADAIDRATDDMANYVSGETTDWDSGMMAVAVYRTMLSAAPASPLPEGGGQCSGITGELSGWQDISTFTESGQGNPVIVAVPTKEGGWIVGEAWKSVMEPGDAYRGNDGWWWAGTSPGDAYNDPIRFMNHGDAEWWMPLPAAPTGEK